MNESKIIDIAERDGVAVVSFLVPSISASAEYEAMAKDFRAYIDLARPTRIVVDFSGLKFFSSQVLGLIVEAWKILGRYGGFVVISGINPQLGRVFKITNLDRLFEFYPDVGTACEALGKKT